MTMMGQVAFHRSLGTFFPIMQFESTATERTLFNRMCFSQALTTLYDCVPLSHPSIDEAMAMWAESIVLASILFSYASGHNKDFSVVHIQQSTSIQSIIS